MANTLRARNLTKNEPVRTVKCPECGAQTVHINFIKVDKLISAVMCDDCAVPYRAVEAFVSAWNADFPRLARQTIEALMARELFALLRPALPPGSMVAALPTEDAEDETPILATFILDSAAPREYATLDFESAYQRRLNTVRAGLPQSRRRGKAYAWEKVAA